MTVTVDLVQLTKVYKNATEPSVDAIDMSIEKGQLVAMLGPSGCGKTTTMKMVAGLLDPTSGDVQFDGASVIDIPAEKRQVAMVFQKPLLFPHMSIGDNVAFGLRMRGVDKKTRVKRVSEMMELVRLPGMEDRRPGQLSGGQEQRISLARGAHHRAGHPAARRAAEPARRQPAHRDARPHPPDPGRAGHHQRLRHPRPGRGRDAGRPHRARCSQGRIQQDGLPQDFYERPATQAVARFFGTQNFVPGTVSGRRFESVLGTLELGHDHPDGEGLLVIRQEAIEIGAGENSFEATVERAMYLGTHVRVWAMPRDVPLQFTAPPGVRYDADQTITPAAAQGAGLGRCPRRTASCDPQAAERRLELLAGGTLGRVDLDLERQSSASTASSWASTTSPSSCPRPRWPSTSPPGRRARLGRGHGALLDAAGELAGRRPGQPATRATAIERAVATARVGARRLRLHGAGPVARRRHARPQHPHRPRCGR